MRQKGFEDLKEFLADNSGFEKDEMQEIINFVLNNLKMRKYKGRDLGNNL
jgi:hypothetical protein